MKAADTQVLVTRLRELLAQGRTEEMFAELTALLVEMTQMNTALQLRMMKLLKQAYGRKSEKMSQEQLSLFLDSLGEAAAPATAASDVVLPPIPALQKKERKGHGRRPLPADLPVEQTIVPAPITDCPTCGKPMTVIGHECKRLLEYVPGHFKIQETLSEKRACGKCAQGVVTAPGPDKLLDGSLVGPGLIAHVLVSKYKDALPLNRLAGIYARSGVELAVSTLADWVGIGTDALKPIADEILKQAKDSFLLQTDDTGLKVLDRDSPHGIKKGHVWVYVGDSKWAAFVYTPNWASKPVQELLEDRVGYLQHDGYAGYDGVHAEGSKAIEVGCNAHFRRGFVDALEGGDARAAVAVELFRQVYQIEELARGRSPEERLALRQAHSRPLMDRLHQWMGETLAKEPPQNKLAKAIQYGANRWEALTRFLDDGRLPPDNNASERALRSIATGRKNYLFAGSDTGAERAAVAYTLIGTCALCGIDPLEYLRDVLTKLSGRWPHSRLAELLPPNWAATRAGAAAAPAPPQAAA
jgi:transposase